VNVGVLILLTLVIVDGLAMEWQRAQQSMPRSTFDMAHIAALILAMVGWVHTVVGMAQQRRGRRSPLVPRITEPFATAMRRCARHRRPARCRS
jgi:hypothetical protein